MNVDQVRNRQSSVQKIHRRILNSKKHACSFRHAGCGENPIVFNWIFSVRKKWPGTAKNDGGKYFMQILQFSGRCPPYLLRTGEGRFLEGRFANRPCGAGGVDVVSVALKPRPLAPSPRKGEGWGRVGEDCGALNPRFRQTNRRCPCLASGRGERGRAVREPHLRRLRC